MKGPLTAKKQAVQERGARRATRTADEMKIWCTLCGTVWSFGVLRRATRAADEMKISSATASADGAAVLSSENGGSARTVGVAVLILTPRTKRKPRLEGTQVAVVNAQPLHALEI